MKCGVKTITVSRGEKHSRFTLMFEPFAIDVLQCAGSVKAAAALLRLSWDAAHEIMKRAVERGLEKRDLEGIRLVGIDEKSFGQDQDYISVMTDPKASRVIEMAEGRTEESAGILWYSLTDEQKSHIAAVSIDMWQTFENSVASHAPQAEIVFDRFHISKHLNEGVNKVRREEHQEELNALQKQQLRTSRAWGIKDYFRWFWDKPDTIAGREFFDHRYNRAICSRLEPMKKVARLLKNRLENILA